MKAEVQLEALLVHEVIQVLHQLLELHQANVELAQQHYDVPDHHCKRLHGECHRTDSGECQDDKELDETLGAEYQALTEFWPSKAAVHWAVTTL